MELKPSAPRPGPAWCKDKIINNYDNNLILIIKETRNTMTDYEQRTLNEIGQEIERNRQWQIYTQDWQQLNKLRKEEQQLIWKYNELQELYYISHLEICQDLNGNILPSKQQILQEVKENDILQEV